MSIFLSLLRAQRSDLSSSISPLFSLSAFQTFSFSLSDYNRRGRIPKADVDVCFNGNIASPGEIAFGGRRVTTATFTD
jgi:hypothetical protein